MFCKEFNPDKQLQICKDEDDAYFGDYPTLGWFQRQYNISAAYWLAPQLVDLSNFAGVNGKLTDRSLEWCALAIAQEYSHLKVSEILYFFFRLKAGHYGKFYGNVDPMMIMQSLREFAQERANAYNRREREKAREEREESLRKAISYEEYLRLKAQADGKEDKQPRQMHDLRPRYASALGQ